MLISDGIEYFEQQSKIDEIKNKTNLDELTLEIIATSKIPVLHKYGKVEIAL